MTALLTLDDGTVGLAIADADGELHDYSLARAEPGLDARAWWLTRSDTDSRHRVGIDRRGRIACTCEDATYRPPRRRRCKHCQTITTLITFTENLFDDDSKKDQKEPAPSGAGTGADTPTAGAARRHGARGAAERRRRARA